MSVLRISSRYSRALIDHAREKDQLDLVHEDALHFINVCNQNRDFLVMLKSPVIAQEIKIRIIQKLFFQHFNELTYNFVSLVLRKRREGLLYDIFKSFVERYNIIKKISSATIESAVPLPDSILSDVKKIVENYTDTRVILNNITNEKIIGGYILKFGDKLMDESITTQLKNLRKQLYN